MIPLQETSFLLGPWIHHRRQRFSCDRLINSSQMWTDLMYRQCERPWYKTGVVHSVTCTATVGSWEQGVYFKDIIWKEEKKRKSEITTTTFYCDAYILKKWSFALAWILFGNFFPEVTHVFCCNRGKTTKQVNSFQTERLDWTSRSSSKPAEFKPVAVVWNIGLNSPQTNLISRLPLFSRSDVNISQVIWVHTHTLCVWVCVVHLIDLRLYYLLEGFLSGSISGWLCERLTDNKTFDLFTPHKQLLEVLKTSFLKGFFSFKPGDWTWR